jgi:hypothetical protein
MYMAGTVPEALRAKAAGADVIVAQGTEGGAEDVKSNETVGIGNL